MYHAHTVLMTSCRSYRPDDKQTGATTAQHTTGRSVTAAESIYDRRFWLCYLSNSMLMVAFSLLFRYADFVSLAGGSERDLGAIVGVGMVGALAMRVSLGIGIDRYGPRPIWLGSLLLFMARGAVKTWREGVWGAVIDEIPDEAESRFNDVIADPQGRVYCGTMATEDRLGRLYKLESDGTLEMVLEGVGCSNGLGFTPDRKQMYYTDSPKREIYLFDYDEATGAIENQRVFVRLPEGGGVPDGMTVDAEGCVWSAIGDGGCLVQFTPDGKEERRVAFPAKKVSCVTFGGRDYTDMYVTTAGGGNKREEGAGAGALFRVNLGIAGVPEFRSRVAL